ncbi:rho GTPase-activating protein 19 isoform X1 [Aplysia californica]|uniref:Rho GTPase-activating protein 19 isoform X1 n=1 Tax=Aplysia californica TaxID=6500 RepID=A0ABM1AFM6_APLCA|nr:rho GTPase-activating protein 19 isoform X1 [Aplysia californica]
MDDTFSERMDPLTPLSQQRVEEDRSVSRMQRLYPEKLRDLCSMHLAFILDLSDTKLEDILSDMVPSTQKKKLGLTPLFKKKEKTPQSVFGAPLTENGVSLMMPLIAHLQNPESLKEGLFRKPGNGRKMKMLKEQLLTKGGDALIDPELFGPHDVACVLKEFLRELPEPLLTNKHIEAYRQIRGLGAHADTAEEKGWYAQRKLSAVQLLIRLAPTPVQKMVRYLMKLLLKVAQEPETKMTPTTLGTIFAPICFLNRKATASDMCVLITETEPSVAFLIENAKELFEVPNGLVRDVMSFWTDVVKCQPEDSSEHPKMKKFTSGPIVNTNICYIDRKASQCEDVATNTQAELASLYAHVQSLPDTPHNVKLKKQIQKGTTTPVSSSKKHPRSKSIGASIKKRLPNLGSTKNKNTEFSVLGSASSSASSEDSLGVYVMSYKSNDQVAVVHCAELDLRAVKIPLVKRLDFSNMQDTVITPAMSNLLNSPTTTKIRGALRESRPRQKRSHTQCGQGTSDCTPPKLECRPKSMDAMALSPKENIPPPVLTSSTHKDSSRMVLKPRASALPSCNSDTQAAAMLQDINDKSAPEKAQAVLRKEGPKRADYCDIHLPISATTLCISQSQMAVAEKEISYLPYQAPSGVIRLQTPERENARAVNDAPLRKCNGAGTPIVRRTLLQLSVSSNFETTI